MEQAIARSEAKSGEDGSRLEFLPVQPTRAAMRYKTNEILALEQEVDCRTPLSKFNSRL